MTLNQEKTKNCVITKSMTARACSSLRSPKNPKPRRDPALEEIMVYIAQFNDRGEVYKDMMGFFVGEAGKKEFRWCANGSYYPVKPQTIDGVIRSYLNQFESSQKIAPDAVNAHIDTLRGQNEAAHDQAIKEHQAEAERRSKINLITKLSSKDAKQYQKRFDLFHYVNKRVRVNGLGAPAKAPKI